MKNFDWTGWTDWTPLATLNLSVVPTDPGAYVIATDRPISRAIGTDENGFLDVGESDGLRTHLRNFIRCMATRGQEGNMAGWRFAFFRFERHFPIDSLRVRWATAETKQAANALEGLNLLEYIKVHCELPPLNYQFNWSGPEEMRAYFDALSSGLIPTESGVF